MTEERFPMPSHGGAQAGPDASDRPLDDPRAIQILATEHWSLLATRSLSWNESFSRAGLFLSVVSATAVALALVAQATSFGPGFIAFALVMLPVDLFVGLATFTRLDEVNLEDVLWVAGMNRIRHAYLEIGPGLAPYFITGATDDPAGVEKTVGIHRPGSVLAHWIVTMPGMVAVIDGVLAGLIVGVAGSTLGGMAMTPSIAVGAVVGILLPVVLAIRSRSSIRWLMGVYRSNFPSDAESHYAWVASGASRSGEDGPGERRS
ncbi:MAG TPA: hypothetical protein VFY18_10890 [Candidatus Limnocylindrales bacterium]|nr:hypothetical protein [Candidatus Limnocylindrales bacterium]